MRKAVLLTVGVVSLLSMLAAAQENRSEVSLQGTGFFTSSVNGSGNSYSATETGGILGTYRYHINHRISAEAAYGYDGNSQKYLFLSEPFRIQSGIHQFTGALVLNLPSSPHSRLNPYVLAGGGALHFAPTSNQVNSLSGAQGQTRGAFVYGVGLNYALRKNISLRAEYRGLVYSAPDFGFGALAPNSVTQSAVPSVGISFRF